MATPNPRLLAYLRWLEANKLSTKRVARESGIANSTLASFVQQDTYTLRGDTEQKIADTYSVSIEDIFVHGRKIDVRSRGGIPIIGKVFAGPEGSYIDDYADGAHPRLPPLDAEDRVAAQVEGDSMLPRFRPRETLIFGPIREDPTPYINQEVMAALAHDEGRKLIKVLRPSSQKGFWDLYSINTSYQVIEGVELAWVRPFEGMHV